MSTSVEQALDAAEDAQQQWETTVPRVRLKKLGRLAAEICENTDKLLRAVERPNASPAEILASEILPLADACRFVARRGRQLLAPTRSSWMYGAWWMGRISVQSAREPWGIVLVIGPSNYPLYLPGVQIVQALAAGNAVLVKPAPNGLKAVECLKELLVRVGVPESLVQILPVDVEAAQQAIDLGVDKVVLTGSAETGKTVLRRLSDTTTPATMELSGCDAAFVSAQASVERAARCIAYGFLLNGGATCIAPRRIFLMGGQQTEFRELLVKELETQQQSTNTDYVIPIAVLRKVRQAAEQALAQGAQVLYGELPTTETSQGEDAGTMTPLVLDNVHPSMEVARADLFAPITSIMPVADMQAAAIADRLCPYGLGASIFASRSFAEHWAGEIEAGCVVINDVVVPTADARVSFGGRDQSGWGVTRGAEGLLEMTRPKTICTRHGDWLPHLDRATSGDRKLLTCLLRSNHARTLRERIAALRGVIGRGQKLKAKSSKQAAND